LRFNGGDCGNLLSRPVTILEVLSEAQRSCGGYELSADEAQHLGAQPIKVLLGGNRH
jgi:hypothetical protein